MAWDGKRPFKSTRESLLNLFDFFEKVMMRVQYPRELPAFSRLNYCDRVSHYRASLAEEEEAEAEEDVLIRPAPPMCQLAGLVLQRRFLATPTVLLLIKTLEMSLYGS